MGTYAVNTSQLRICAEELGGLQRELDSVALRLAGFQVGSILQLRGYPVLMARVGDCKWAAINQSDDVGRMSRGLADVAELYETVEKALTDPQTKAQAQARAEAEKADQSFWDVLVEYFPFLEVIGFQIESVGRLVWELGDDFGNVVSWAMSCLESILDNVEEFSDDLFNAQFLYELVGEAAVDIVLGLGVGAALTALTGGAAAVAGTIGAPVVVGAVVLAAAGAAICWVGDSICRWITGDDISELLVDVGWEIMTWADQTADAVAETAEALWNSAGEFIDTLLPW